MIARTIDPIGQFVILHAFEHTSRRSVVRALREVLGDASGQSDRTLFVLTDMASFLDVFDCRTLRLIAQPRRAGWQTKRCAFVVPDRPASVMAEIVLHSLGIQSEHVQCYATETLAREWLLIAR